jgi:purine-binding chemotaxis protein CheW
LGFSETIPDTRIDARTLLFRVADRVYGCDIEAVREIIPYRRATRLPGAPPSIQGLDAERPPVREGSIILAALGTRVVGVAVDEVMDVQTIAEEPLAAGAGDVPRGLVRGLGHLDDGVVVLVDIHALVTQVLL